MSMERAADTATGVSLTAFGLSIASWNEIATLIALLVSIGSGIFAMSYYWNQKRNENIKMLWQRKDRAEAERHKADHDGQ